MTGKGSRRRKKSNAKETPEETPEEVPPPSLHEMSDEEREAFMKENEAQKDQLVAHIVATKAVLSLAAVMVGHDVFAYFPPDERNQWDFLGIAPGSGGHPQGMWRVRQAQAQSLVLPPGVR